MYQAIGYEATLNSYKQTLDSFVGPTRIFSCGNTLQVKDYSKYKWTMFDPEAKKKYHDETFEGYLEKAKEAGKNLLK